MPAPVDAESVLIRQQYRKIINNYPLPYLKLKLSFPYKEMYNEAYALKDRFVDHRYSKSAHNGWKSLCLHGISAEHTNHYDMYGYKSKKDVKYVWTDIADLCPITTNYFKNIFPLKSYSRLRFMWLTTNGWIGPHTDDPDNDKLAPINFALNNPEYCIFKFSSGHVVPYTAGEAYFLNVANEHSVWNNSTEDRIHIIAHCDDKGTNLIWQKLVIDSIRC